MMIMIATDVSDDRPCQSVHGVDVGDKSTFQPGIWFYSLANRPPDSDWLDLSKLSPWKCEYMQYILNFINLKKKMKINKINKNILKKNLGRADFIESVGLPEMQHFFLA